MIFYTTGTGNSRWVANEIGRLTGDSVIAIDKELKTNDKLHYDSTPYIFVMPVHAWGPALLMMRFIRRAEFNKGEAHCIFVCGDMCGNADNVVAKALKKKGITVVGNYSVQMPNTYILLKGFGIDSQQLAKAKLQAAPERVAAICRAITDGTDIANPYVRGGLPGLKTGLVYRLFARFAIKRVNFRSTNPCISCGLCATVCPTGNIVLRDGRPTWSNDCVQCLACIHRCPHRAIEYGTVTESAGRYCHPSLRNAMK